MRSRYRFLTKPKWIAGHLIVIVAVVVFVSRGVWQLRRLHDRQDFNSILVSRTAELSRPIGEVIEEFRGDDELLELRTVTAVGQYSPGEEVILLARSYNGLSGHHVLTPLYLADGSAVIVDRGWVSIDLDMPGMDEFAPPEGEVTVSGILRKTEVRGSFGPTDPADGVLTQTVRVDLERIDQQVAGDLLPVYVQLLEQDPAQAESVPAVVDLPQPSEGSHRGYAVQWFLFALVAGVGYPILIWRTADDQA